MFYNDNDIAEFGMIIDNINDNNIGSDREHTFIIEDKYNINFNTIDNFTQDEKLDECISRLTDIDKEIIEYENNIDKLWIDLIEPQYHSDNDMILDFKNKFDFFDYMIGKEEYSILIDKQSKLNYYIELLNNCYKNNSYDENDSDSDYSDMPMLIEL